MRRLDALRHRKSRQQTGCGESTEEGTHPLDRSVQLECCNRRSDPSQGNLDRSRVPNSVAVALSVTVPHVGRRRSGSLGPRTGVRDRRKRAGACVDRTFRQRPRHHLSPLAPIVARDREIRRLGGPPFAAKRRRGSFVSRSRRPTSGSSSTRFSSIGYSIVRYGSRLTQPTAVRSMARSGGPSVNMRAGYRSSGDRLGLRWDSTGFALAGRLGTGTRRRRVHTLPSPRGAAARCSLSLMASPNPALGTGMTAMVAAPDPSRARSMR